jgi:hypothetical protein
VRISGELCHGLARSPCALDAEFFQRLFMTSVAEACASGYRNASSHRPSAAPHLVMSRSFPRVAESPESNSRLAEWYMATSARRGYVHAIFDRQTRVAIENLSRIAKSVEGNVVIVFLCGTDFGIHTSSFC